MNCNICFNNHKNFVTCDICNNKTCNSCFKKIQKCPFCRTHELFDKVKQPINSFKTQLLKEQIIFYKEHIEDLKYAINSLENDKSYYENEAKILETQLRLYKFSFNEILDFCKTYSVPINMPKENIIRALSIRFRRNQKLI
jgi:hypothetical protein